MAFRKYESYNNMLKLTTTNKSYKLYTYKHTNIDIGL